MRGLFGEKDILLRAAAWKRRWRWPKPKDFGQYVFAKCDENK